MLDHLRRRTRDLHEALHRHPMLAPLEAGTIMPEQYRAVIGMFSGVYGELEPQSRRQRPLGCGLPDAPVLEWLAGDAEACGGVSAASSLPALTLEGLGARLGYLYVKQGSTLGGQLIAKRLRRMEPEGTQSAFFTGYGADTGRQWRLFTERLAAPEFAVYEQRAGDAAEAVFGIILAACNSAFQDTFPHDASAPRRTDRPAA